MTTPPAQPPPAHFNINLTPEMEAGTYADFASIWHNEATFIMDFIAMVNPPQLGQDENDQPIVQMNGRVVSRIRIPASQCWELMKGLENQLSQWEAASAAAKAAEPPPPGS